MELLIVILVGRKILLREFTRFTGVRGVRGWGGKFPVHFQNAAQEVSVALAFYFTAPSSPPSDCWRLRFSLRVDIMRLINSHIIIIIIIIIIIWSVNKHF